MYFYFVSFFVGVLRGWGGVLVFFLSKVTTKSRLLL